MCFFRINPMFCISGLDCIYDCPSKQWHKSFLTNQLQFQRRKHSREKLYMYHKHKVITCTPTKHEKEIIIFVLWIWIYPRDPEINLLSCVLIASCHLCNKYIIPQQSHVFHAKWHSQWRWYIPLIYPGNLNNPCQQIVIIIYIIGASHFLLS